MIISHSTSRLYEIFTYYLPLIFCSLSILGAIIIIITYAKFLRMRIYVGKAFLHTSIVQLMLSLLFLFSLYYKSEEQMEDPDYPEPNHFYIVIDKTWGTIIGGIEVHVSLCHYLYHFFISHNLYYSFMKSQQGLNFKRRFKRYVAMTHFISLSVAIGAMVTGQIGMQDTGIFGICMKSQMQILYLGVLAIILPFSLFSIIYSKYHNRKLDCEAKWEDSYETEIRHDFVTSNCLYLITFIITWMPYAVVSYVGYTQPDNCACLESNSLILNILKVLTLNLVSMTTFLIGIIRLTRPVIKRNIKAYFRTRSQNEELRMSLLEDDNDNDSLRSSSFVSERSNFGSFIGIQNPSLIEKVEIEFKPTQNHMWESRSTASRATFKESINSILECPRRKNNISCKKSVSLGEIFDILLAIIHFLRNKKSTETSSYNPRTPWLRHYYNFCRTEEVDPNVAYSTEEKEFLIDQIKKPITLHVISYVRYSEDVFNHLQSIWGVTLETLVEALDYKENIKFCASLNKKSLNHLEKRYFYMTPNKKVLFEQIDKESKLFFIDTFLSDYHHYMANNPNSFLVKFLQLYQFTFTNNSHNIMAILNNYEPFYGVSEKEKKHSGMPFSITQRYLLDGKLFRYEEYSKGTLKKKMKTSISEKNFHRVFYLPKELKGEIMDQLKKDLSFLNRNELINYRVVLLVSKDESIRKSLIEQKYRRNRLTDGTVILQDNSLVKIFIDTNIVTSKMKGLELKKKNPLFSIENSEIYRQCITEMMNSIL